SNTTSTTPNPPTLSGDDIANTLAASHTFGDTAIVVSENGSLFTAYSNKINVGNVARPAGYWKFKVKAATLRHESVIVNSPEFTITNTTIITTPVAPTVVGNAATMALIASHPLGDSVILVSENGGTYMAYTGKINVGNVTRPPGYWKFKVKSGFQRSESVVISSPEFTFTTLPVATTPAAPIVVGDNGAKILIASHSLGDSVILVCENGGPYLPYAGQINVGDVAKPAGYWKFKTKVGVGRNESLVSESPAFNITIQNITPAPPTITIDDINNMLTASHVLGASEIVVSANGSGFVQYPGTITVGNVDREAGYYKFKIKAAPGRNESILAASPAFTINTLNITPATPIIVADDAGNTLTASHALGDAEILVSENGGVFAAYFGLINVGNVNREAGYYKFRIKAAAGRNESAIANSPAFTVTIPNTTPDAPTLIPDDAANTLIAVHALGNTEILVSENGGAFGAYSGQINVGNVSRPAAYWKFKIKTATGRNESLIANSPAFTVTIPNTTPDAPILIPDDAANTLIAVHALGNAEILVSENGGAFGAYSGQINVGNVSRPAAYWRFKIKAALQRNESAVINSPEFTATATPDAPIITGDDVANTLTATHSLGSTQIVVSENGAAYLAYTGLINVGNVSRPAGYWKFKIKAVLQRNESVVVNSPVFTVTVTPDAPVIVGDDGANTLIASHTLGTREILVSENGGTFATYTGIINVGNVSRPSGYWKFKIKAALQRNESAVINSPEFTATTAPPAPEVIGNDIANTLVATHALGNSEIVVSENGGAFVTYLGPINVGNVSRPAGYWKFKIKGSIQRNESAVVNSPIFTITVTPVAPDLSADDAANTLTAFHSLGTTEILVSVNGGPFAVFTGMINVGNVSRPAGYWRFKIKAALQRDESSVVSSPLFTINAIIVAPNVNALTLPVQLTSLKATQVDKEVLVQWNATSELNLDRYEVERSTDGRQFRVIGTVPAKGNAVSSDYEFFDKTPFSEDNYYRIKSIDKSGEIRFSNVVYVKFITNNGTLNVYPNPIISNNIFIQSNNLAKGEYVVSLLTSTGQTIFTKVIGHVGGMFTYSVPLSSSLAKGVYMFHFSGKELRFNKQLLK
ncbi:T9SS type A sorting domain-containing protein, partial [Segetibacter sp.]|uniref:T9SS type A sorting domain-containing protein n=1 Tax=Segetibacter sp. TaxID=2231182 RepID=UPI00260A88FE